MTFLRRRCIVTHGIARGPLVLSRRRVPRDLPVRGWPVLIRGDDARAYYLSLLGRVLERTDAEVIAWCLMSSHVHLIVVQGTEPLERLFKPLHTGFARFINRQRRGRGAKGSVFAERPRTLLVDADAYLLELVRYVHNNPARAGLVRFARVSPWSSHQAYIGRCETPSWLRCGYVLDQFGRSAAHATRAFDQFVDDGRHEPRSLILSGGSTVATKAAVDRATGDGWRAHGGILGDESFVKRVRRDLARTNKALTGGRLPARSNGRVPQPRVRDVVDEVLALLDVEPLEFEERPKARISAIARRLIVWCWVRHLGGRQVDVARELGTATAAVSRWYGQAVSAAADLEPLADVVVQQLSKRRRRRSRDKAQTNKVHYDVVVEE